MLRPQRGEIPSATPSALSKTVWDGFAQGQLLFQSFPELPGRAQFPPSPVDRVSLSNEYEWERSAGLGRVYSWSTVWRGQTADFEVPYVVAIIELDEGFQMIANIIGCRFDEIEADMRVEVEFHPTRNGLVLPYFRPLGGHK